MAAAQLNSNTLANAAVLPSGRARVCVYFMVSIAKGEACDNQRGTCVGLAGVLCFGNQLSEGSGSWRVFKEAVLGFPCVINRGSCAYFFNWS